MFLTDNAKLDGTPNKAKLNEKYTLVFILFQVLKILLIKKIQLPVFLFLFVFYQLLHQQISFLQNFSTSFNTIWNNIFVTNFFFFLTDSSQSPYASEIIRESDREDWPFRVSLKNSCNEKLSKVGVIEVGKRKTRAG